MRRTASNTRQQQQQQQQQQQRPFPPTANSRTKNNTLFNRQRSLSSSSHESLSLPLPPPPQQQQANNSNNNKTRATMGTDANQKSANKSSAAKNRLQMLTVFIAFTFVWIQVHSNFNINDLMELDQTISGTAYNNNRANHEKPVTTRGLLTDEDRDFIQDNNSMSSSSGKKSTAANNKVSSSTSDTPSAAAAAAQAAKEVHALETAKLKAEADKAKAEAEMAKLEAEKLRLEVAKAQLDADKARAEADKANANIKATKDKAALQAKIAAKQAARAEREKFKEEEKTRAQKDKANAALQAKIAAKQASRVAEEEEAAAAKNAKKDEEEEEEVQVASVSNEEKEAAVEMKQEKEPANDDNGKEEEVVGETVEAKEVEEDKAAPTVDDSKEKKDAAKAKLQAKIAAKQAARAEKEAKQKKEKEEAELAEKIAKQKEEAELAAKEAKEKKEKEEAELAAAKEKALQEEEEQKKKEREQYDKKKVEEEEKEASKARLRAKIAAKQAARAEKEAADKAKKDDGKESTTKEKRLPVVPQGPNFDNDDTSIRQWGCARNETPFIFVHIGKAGGGGVRSRMAAAALDYKRTAWYRVQDDKTYYYPVYDAEGKLHRGKFESSKMTNWVPKNFTEIEKDFAFEGFAPCAATTPLGQALSCPMPSRECGENKDDTNKRCDLVYMGHNVLGSELHWLPTNYLVNWWKTTEWGKKKDDYIKWLLKDRFKGGGGEFGDWDIHLKPRRLMKYKYPDMACPPGPLIYRDFKKHYDKCAAPKEPWLDQVTQITTGTEPVVYGSQVISSMPVMRVTVLRDPFSWLTSKFFWHPYHFGKGGRQVSPDSGKKKNDALIADAKKNMRAKPNFIKCDDIDEAANGWASLRALTYIFYLCGEHCMGGYKKGTMNMDDLERQAAYNLRHSFAVVGLLQKTDEFYDMVDKRVYYMNMHLNPDVKGKEHSSGKNEENMRCKEVYKDPDFQTKMMEASPALAALYRLYQVAVEVNAFQEKELAECKA